MENCSWILNEITCVCVLFHSFQLKIIRAHTPTGNVLVHNIVAIWTRIWIDNTFSSHHGATIYRASVAKPSFQARYLKRTEQELLCQFCQVICINLIFQQLQSAVSVENALKVISIQLGTRRCAASASPGSRNSSSPFIHLFNFFWLRFSKTLNLFYSFSETWRPSRKNLWWLAQWRTFPLLRTEKSV